MPARRSRYGLHFGGKSTINVDINDLIFRKISLIPTFAEPAINFPVSNRLLREGLVDAETLAEQLGDLEVPADKVDPAER